MQLRKLFPAITAALLCSLNLNANASIDLENGKLDREHRLKSIALVKEIKDWLLSPTGDGQICSGGDCYDRTYGMLRKEMVIVSEDETKVDTYRSEVLSSKICHTMRFLVKAGKSQSISYDAKADIARLGQLLIDRFQFVASAGNQNSALSGGFLISENESAMTTQGTALCGLALLDSWEFLESWRSPVGQRNTDHSFFRAAMQSANFLETMHKPSLYPPLSSLRFTNHDSKASFGAFMDEVHPLCRQQPCSSSEMEYKMVISSTAWNALGFAVFSRLENVPELNFDSSFSWRQTGFYTNLIRDRYEGVNLAYDLNPSQSDYIHFNSYLGTSLPPGETQDVYRNKWGIAIRSDMPEYVINALREINNTSARSELFNAFHHATSLTKDTSTGSWRAFTEQEISEKQIDPMIGWSGVFLVGHLDEEGNYSYSDNVRHPLHQHDHYDFDAIAAETKAEFMPCETQNAASRLLQDQSDLENYLQNQNFQSISWNPANPHQTMKASHWLYALLSHDLKPYRTSAKPFTNEKELNFVNNDNDGVTWSKGESVHKYSRASSTAAHNATFLLRALEIAQNGNISCD